MNSWRHWLVPASCNGYGAGSVSDEHTFCIFNDAEYDPLSQIGRTHIRGFPLSQGENGLIPKLWLPSKMPLKPGFMADTSDQVHARCVPAAQEDEVYALANGYCVMNDDGTPYRLTDHWFGNSLPLDFTNPAAVKWWFSKRIFGEGAQ